MSHSTFDKARASQDASRSGGPPPQDGSAASDNEAVPPPGFWQLLQSVLAAMFGVQSESARRRDFTRGRPMHYIVIGLVATVLFVLTIVFVVQLILRLVGA